MAFTRYDPTTRLPKERNLLRNNQFAKFISQRTGVSSSALAKAMQLFTNGLIEALAEGYEISLHGLGTFEVRELKPRLRYHRVNKTRYMSKPSTIIHFKKSDSLTKKVRQLASDNLETMTNKTHVNPNTK